MEVDSREDGGDLVLTARKDDPVEEIVAIICSAKKFNVRLAEHFVNVLHRRKCKHAIIVFQSSITGFARRVLDTTTSTEIELFCGTELMIDVTNHILQPRRFRRLPTNEVDDFKAKKFFDVIPRMDSTDPIARYFNFRVGDVIEITRRSGVVVYRRVRFPRK